MSTDTDDTNSLSKFIDRFNKNLYGVSTLTDAAIGIRCGGGKNDLKRARQGLQAVGPYVLLDLVAGLVSREHYGRDDDAVSVAEREFNALLGEKSGSEASDDELQRLRQAVVQHRRVDEGLGSADPSAIALARWREAITQVLEASLSWDGIAQCATSFDQIVAADVGPNDIGLSEGEARSALPEDWRPGIGAPDSLVVSTGLFEWARWHFFGEKAQKQGFSSGAARFALAADAVGDRVRSVPRAAATARELEIITKFSDVLAALNTSLDRLGAERVDDVGHPVHQTMRILRDPRFLAELLGRWIWSDLVESPGAGPATVPRDEGGWMICQMVAAVVRSLWSNQDGRAGPVDYFRASPTGLLSLTATSDEAAPGERRRFVVIEQGALGSGAAAKVGVLLPIHQATALTITGYEMDRSPVQAIACPVPLYRGVDPGTKDVVAGVFYVTFVDPKPGVDCRDRSIVETLTAMLCTADTASADSRSAGGVFPENVWDVLPDGSPAGVSTRGSLPRRPETSAAAIGATSLRQHLATRINTVHGDTGSVQEAEQGMREVLMIIAAMPADSNGPVGDALEQLAMWRARRWASRASLGSLPLRDRHVFRLSVPRGTAFAVPLGGVTGEDWRQLTQVEPSSRVWEVIRGVQLDDVETGAAGIVAEFALPWSWHSFLAETRESGALADEIVQQSRHVAANIGKLNELLGMKWRGDYAAAANIAAELLTELGVQCGVAVAEMVRAAMLAGSPEVALPVARARHKLASWDVANRANLLLAWLASSPVGEAEAPALKPARDAMFKAAALMQSALESKDWDSPRRQLVDVLDVIFGRALTDQAWNPFARVRLGLLGLANDTLFSPDAKWDGGSAQRLRWDIARAAPLNPRVASNVLVILSALEGAVQRRMAAALISSNARRKRGGPAAGVTSARGAAPATDAAVTG